jgi:hypothetical protein
MIWTEDDTLVPFIWEYDVTFNYQIQITYNQSKEL